MFKRKLFKRALPIILSVAMVFQSMPATALAAEDPVVVETNVEDSGTTDSADETTASEVEEPAGENQEQSDVSQAGDTQPEETPDATADPEDSSESAPGSATSQENVDASGTDIDSADTPASESEQEETTAEEQLGAAAETAALDTVIRINESVRDYLVYSNNFKEISTNSYAITYTGETSTFNSVKSQLENSKTYYFEIEIDGVVDEVSANLLNGSVNLKWQKVLADGGKEDIGSPVDAGKYQLVITLDEVADVCKGTSAVIDFEIMPVELEIQNNWNTEIPAGTTVGEYKERLKQVYALYNSNEYRNVDKAAVVIEKDVEIVVINSYTKVVLADAEVLRSDVDYSVYFAKMPLAESMSVNYKVSGVGEEYVHRINVSDLTKTEVAVEQNDAGKEITVVYDADSEVLTAALEKAVADAVKSVKVYIKPDSGNASEEKTEITLAEGETPTLEWCTKSINPDTSNPYGNTTFVYNPLGEGVVPTEAGTYYVRYRFAGREGSYEESVSDAIKVTVEPVSLILKPDEASKPTLLAGMKGSEVQEALASLTYKLYPYTVDNAGKITLAATPHTEEENFWGVAYNDKNETQYYRPLFELEYHEAKTNENGEILKEDNKVQYYDWSVWNNNEPLRASEGSDREIEYRIVFSGYKTVFGDDNYQDKMIEVTDTTTMEAEKNYLVKADVQTRHLDGEPSVVLPVDVKTANKVEIDVTGIINAFKSVNSDTKDTDGLTEESPLWKIYDGEALYTKREDYKKAGIKVGDAASATTTLKETETLSYTWAYKAGENWRSLGSIAVDSDLVSSLSESGVYRLTVTYTDATHANQNASKAVYFEVKQQEVMVVGEGFTARVGKTVGDLSGSYRVYKLPNNSEADFANLSDTDKQNAVVSLYELFNYDPDDWRSESEFKNEVNNRLTIKVQRQEKDDAGNDVPGKYIDVPASEEFVAGYTYRACLYFAYPRNTNYTNQDNAATKAAEADEDAESPVYHLSWFDLDLQNIGSEELAVIVDKTKLPASKVYDGEIIDIEEAFKNGLLKIVLKNDHAQEVTDLTIGSAEEYFASLDDPTVEKKDVYYGVAVSSAGNSRKNGFAYSGYALDADTYYLGVWFDGNEKYKDFDIVFNGAGELENYSFEIKQQPITIRPVLTGNTLAAGEQVYNLYDTGNSPFEVVKGKIAPIDERAFAYGSWIDDDGEIQSGYYAFGGRLWPAYQYDKIDVDGSDYLRYGKTYEVDFELYNALQGIYAQNYDIAFEKATYKVEKRGNAEVTSSNYNRAESVRLTTTIEQGVSQTIIPVEGIPFSYDVYLPDGETKDGNFFAFKITAPKEYTNSDSHSEYSENYRNFIYEKDIKNNGGYLIGSFGYDNEDNYITVLFDVTDMKDLSAEDPKRQKEFSICWEDGYVEKFVLDFSNAVLEDNLKEAVAPKSLAFNGISNKMVVGEEQNLDVKITKVQLGDIISIAYETDAADVLSIDKQTGHVTALQAGKSATVTAYAYKLDKDGNEERLGKAATAKITVTDVTAPAIKKIDTASDNGAAMHFTAVTNGYRRELYVLAGKAKVTDFDPEIEKLEKGQANNLVKVVYDVERYSVSEYDKNGKFTTYKYVLTGLDKEQEYTVYLRNVSAVRTLADGSSVKLSAKGVVKNFKTTKPQVQELVLYSEDTAATEIDWAERYSVSLDSKKIQMITGGIYKDYGEFADSNDVITRVLPTKDKDVVNPKLTYEVHDYGYKYDDDGNRYYGVLEDTTSKYAAVSNKGQLTLKGVGLNGRARVQVKVTSDNGKSAICDVIITAEPTAVTAKNAKMKVGESIVFSDYLNYTQGKTKVLNHVSSWLQIVNRDELAEQGISFYTEYVDGYYRHALTAAQDGNFEIKIRDLALQSHADDPNTYVTLKLSVGKLDPVKNLKVAYVDDSRITINFAHTGSPSDFLITVEDGRGSLVSRKLVSRSGASFVSANAANCYQEGQRWVVGELTYFAKTKTYAYTINKNLIRQSAYKISVTAMYDGTEAKAATAKTKTTNIPASKVNMAASEYTYGGARIYVTDASQSINGYSSSISQNPYLVSGNTYTLNLDANYAAKTRITDTLAWKSSDTKVASVKANAGTYTATLKAVKQGTTTIEVTSKITKKVIARYLIAVKPVTNGQNYYGDYEKEAFRLIDPLYDGEVEVLTLSNKVSVQKFNSSTEPYTWVAFTAPTFGEYTFDCTYYNNSYSVAFGIYDKVSGDQLSNYNNGTATKFLEAGQKIYFRVSGSFTLSAAVKEFGKLTVDSPIAVKSGTWVSFVAPEDNYYTFTGVGAQIKVIKNSDLESDSLSYNYGQQKYGRSMKAGESILLQANSSTVSVEKRNLAKEELSADSQDKTVTLTADVKEQWFRFTAPATAEYTFVITGAEISEFDFYKDIYSETPGKWYPDISNITAQASAFTAMAKAAEEAGGADTGTETTPQPKYSAKIRLNEGDVVMLKLSVSDESFTEENPTRAISINVSQPKVEALNAGANTVTLPNTADTVWRSYVVGEGYYSFGVEGIDGSNPEVEYYNSRMEHLDSSNMSLVVPSSDRNVKAGDKIYLKVTNGSATVTITEVKATELKAGTAEKVELIGKGSSNLEYWYTFKAPRTGKYVFRFETDKMKDGYNTEGAGNYLSIVRYSGIWGDWEEYFDIWNESKEVELSMGEILTFCLTVDEITDENFKWSGNIYVDDVNGGTGVTAVKTGEENSIELKDAKDITNWYVFTAGVTDTYTFTWKPADNSGDVELGIYSDMASGRQGVITVSGRSKHMDAGEKIYIKAVQTTTTAVNGKLAITVPAVPEKIKGDTLTFKDLANGTTKEYTFTASQTTKYAIVTTMAENKTASVYFENYGYVDSYDKIDFSKGKTYIVRVTATSDGASGTVTIKPIVPTELKADDNVTAKKDGNPSWYVWTVEKAGRYDLVCSANDKMSISYYKELGSNQIRAVLGSYYEAGETVYIKATTSATDADQTAKFTPDINYKDLVLDKESLVTLAKGTKEDYKYTVAEDGVYTFTKSLPAENGAYPQTVTYAVNTENDWELIGNVTDVSLKKGDILYVTIDAMDDADANFIFKMEKRKETVLTAGKASEEVTLAAGKTAWFSFDVKENGEFAFKTQDVTPNTASLSRGSVSEFVTSTPRDNGFYFVCKGTFNNKITFSVTNNSAEEVKFKVFAERVQYAELTEAKELKDIDVAKGELKWLKFTAPEDGRYTFTSSTENVSLQALSDSLSDEKPIAKGKTVTMYLINNTEDATAKTTVSVKSVKPEEITDTPITVAAGESKWVKYTAKEDGTYTFTLQNTTAEEAQDADIYYCTSILDNPFSAWDSTVTITLRADKVAYFKLTNNNPEAEEKYAFSCTFNAPMKPVTYNYVFETYEDTHEVTFIAPHTGTYKITGSVPSDGKSDFNVYVNGNSSINVWYNSNDRQLLLKKMNEGETVELNIVPYYADSRNGEFGGSIMILVEQIIE